MKDEGDLGQLKETNKSFIMIIKDILGFTDTIERQAKSVITHNDKIGIIFLNNDSDILYLNRLEAKILVKQAELALEQQKSETSVFGKDGLFSFIKQDNNNYLLSIYINERYSTGKILTFQNVKEIIFLVNNELI